MCRHQAPNTAASRAAVSLKAKRNTIEAIVSQNVRGLKSDARLEELFASILRHDTFAACLQETWRCGNETLENGSCRLIHAGLDADEQSTRGSQGVAIVLSARGVDSWRAAGSITHQDLGARVVAIRLLVQDIEKRDVGVFLVSAYAPIGVADNNVWDDFFANLDRCIARKQRGDILLIGADTNSSMGCKDSVDERIETHQQHPLGKFGLHHTNNAGERFASYLAVNNMIALNTFFRKRQYGTWMHPRSKLLHQIDHFITSSDDFCRYTDAGLTVSLIDSDHKAIGCKLRIMARLKKRTPQRQRLLRINYDSLRDEGTKKVFCEKVTASYATQSISDTLYTRLASAVNTAALHILPKKQRPQPGWFAAAEHKLLPLIEKRNAAMSTAFQRRTRLGTQKLREARHLLKSAVTSAKNEWIFKQCQIINDASSGHGGTKACWDTLSVLRRGLSKTRPSVERAMKKPDGSVCKSPAENAEVFRNHFSELYGRQPTYDESVLELLQQQPIATGLDHMPTDDEILSAVCKLKNKAPGDSGLTPQVWKTLVTDELTFSILREVIIEFWNSEVTPSEWERGLLMILAKKGDLSLPGNYRGIMLLEAAYKIIAIILHARLLPIEEGIDHETQCGFRPGRGCTDAVFTVKIAMKKRREHGLESWILFIDLVKAFDRVPREMLWQVLAKFGVPPKLIRLLQSLHGHVEVKFMINEVTNTVECIIGVKQGDILGPILFTFYLAAIIITWKAEFVRPLCMFRTNADFVMTGRDINADGDDFDLSDSEYADDTAVLFVSRDDVVESTPVMIGHFARFGMDIHVGSEGNDSKSVVLFAAAPSHVYEDPDTYDGQDLSNIELGDGTFMPVVAEFRYLGSFLTRDCRDDRDVIARIEAAGGAFGALRKSVFASTYISFRTKKIVYAALIISILLYGSESWSLTEKLLHKLRLFHHRCIRAMCRVTRRHTRQHHIRTAELLTRVGLASLDTYIARRQLRWAGHVARMSTARLPRKMLSSWVCQKRPQGCPQYTYGRSLVKVLRKVGVDTTIWPALAAYRASWRTMIDSISI